MSLSLLLSPEHHSHSVWFLYSVCLCILLIRLLVGRVIVRVRGVISRVEEAATTIRPDASQDGKGGGHHRRGEGGGVTTRLESQWKNESNLQINLNDPNPQYSAQSNGWQPTQLNNKTHTPKATHTCGGRDSRATCCQACVFGSSQYRAEQAPIRSVFRSVSGATGDVILLHQKSLVVYGENGTAHSHTRVGGGERAMLSCVLHG